VFCQFSCVLWTVKDVYLCFVSFHLFYQALPVYDDAPPPPVPSRPTPGRPSPSAPAVPNSSRPIPRPPVPSQKVIKIYLFWWYLNYKYFPNLMYPAIYFSWWTFVLYFWYICWHFISTCMYILYRNICLHVHCT
jgi:hypothetical protein